MQNDLLLTAETLWLNPDLVCGKRCNDGFAIKCLSSQGYITVNDAQAKILNEFATRRTVPEVLELCIRNRTCLPLHEFYDLILKAHAAGILRAEMAPTASVTPAVRWFVAIPSLVLVPVIAVSYIAALASILLWLPPVPTALLDVVYGWLAIGATISLGHLIGASALRGAGCEVYRPHLRWFYGLVPHFAVDLRDSCMTTTIGRVAVNASSIVPLAITVAAAEWFGAKWVFVPAVAFVLECRPFGFSTLSKVIYLARRRMLLATDRPPLFHGDHTVGELLRQSRRQFDVRVTLLQVVIALAWAFMIVVCLSRYLGLALAQCLPDRHLLGQIAAGTASALVAAALWWLANLIQHHVVAAIVAGWRSIRLQWSRWIGKRKQQPTPIEIEALVRRNPLLRRLDVEEQDELILHLRPFTAPALRTLVQFEEDPPFVALIVSGSASIYRRTKTGRRSRFLKVVEGDLFGAHKLVDHDYPSLEVRTRTPLVALVIDRDEFARIVINKFGLTAVRNYVHRHLFLQRVSDFCADWKPASIARFAELTAMASHSPGRKIILRGQDVTNLYVLYEGHARALRDSKAVGDIGIGEAFGEISLLQSSAATADVESKDTTSCLLVNRVEFIRFLARNHHVALQVERLCSRRLGRPIFPFEGQSFEIR